MYITEADSDLEIIRGGGVGVLPIMAYIGEVPWLPLERSIFLVRLQVRMSGDFSSRSILKSTENQKG